MVRGRGIYSLDLCCVIRDKASLIRIVLASGFESGKIGWRSLIGLCVIL